MFWELRAVEHVVQVDGMYDYTDSKELYIEFKFIDYLYTFL